MNLQFRVTDQSRFRDIMAAAFNRIQVQWDWSQELAIEFKPYVEKRSRSQNNLYWVWMGVLAEQLSTKDHAYDKNDFHDMLRHKFLGTETVIIAGVETHRQPSTTKLEKAAMSHYMTQIEAWAADMAVYLPIPADNEYKHYREAQQ